MDDGGEVEAAEEQFAFEEEAARQLHGSDDD
jgi:hypothetical protein